MAASVVPSVSSAAPSARDRFRGRPDGPPVTLVVDAGPLSRDSTARVLARSGIGVRFVRPDRMGKVWWSGVECVVVVAKDLGVDVSEVVGAVAQREPRPRILVLGPPSMSDRTTVFGAGADDVVTGPVGEAEAVTRVARVTYRPQVEPLTPVEVGGLFIDRDRREARVDGVAARLTPLRFDLLVVLAQAAGTPVPGPELLRRCWDPHREVSGTHLRPQLARLRIALGRRVEITWSRGKGYVLICDP